MKNNLIKILIISLVILVIFCFTIYMKFPLEFTELISNLNILISALTLIALIFYAYDTHRMANQIEEQNWRPIVLRSGFISSWNDIKFKFEKDENGNLIARGEPLKFSVLRNIARDIEGYIILNNKKYKLLFTNRIAEIRTSERSDTFSAYLTEKWGWLAPNTINPDYILYAVFDPDKFETINSENMIFITYSDILGNRYYTKEDKNFNQTSGRL